ncbi:MAG: peptide deformylase [Candidatus Paceibacterota bacterium]|jgi:peptide deformylase
MVKIIQNGNKTLRQVAKVVPIKNIGSKKLNKIILDMKKALNSQHDGVAIAAPQIDVPLRIFVVSGRIFDKDFGTHDYDPKNITGKKEDLVFINPEIVKLSREKEEVPEGCLSVRWLYGDVKRSTRATVKAYDENGNKIERGGSGILAQIFQHETDHLNGVLFIDKAKNIAEMKP